MTFQQSISVGRIAWFAYSGTAPPNKFIIRKRLSGRFDPTGYLSLEFFGDLPFSATLASTLFLTKSTTFFSKGRIVKTKAR
jgi:hypothetical protein